MKRFLSLFICVILLFSLVSCDDDGKKELVLDENGWKDAIKLANFDNVTMTMNVVLEEEGTFVIKLDGNKAELDGLYVDDEATVSSCRNIYVETSVAMVKNFSDFVYDKEAGVFKSNKAIEYDVTVQGYDAHITTENVTVRIDTKKRIAEIDCDMKQEFNNGQSDVCFDFHIKLTFSDYGKTVVEP